METLEEKVKRLEEEKKSLNDIIKTQEKEIKELSYEADCGGEFIEYLMSELKELLEALKKMCEESPYVYHEEIEKLIKKHKK